MSQDQVRPSQVTGRPEIPWSSPGYVQPLVTPEPNFIYEWVTQTIRFIDHNFDMAKRLCNSMKAMTHALQGHPGQTGPSEEFWQTVVHWRRQWTHPVLSPGDPHRQYEKAERYDTGRRVPTGRKLSNMLLGKSGGQLLTAPEKMKWRPKREWCSAVDVSGGESKVWCCKEQYCVGTWNVRSRNQGKWDIVKEEMARLKINVGKIEGERRKRTKSLDGITDSMDMILSKLQEMVENRGAWCATVHEVSKSQTRLSDWKIAQSMDICCGLL